MTTSIADWPGLEDATRTLQLLMEPRGVIEMRALNVGGAVVSQYCTEHEPVLVAAFNLEDSASGIYVTLNSIRDELRSRLTETPVRGPKSTTADTDIKARRFLLIDTDPNRQSGVSATDEEKKAALAVSDAIEKYLTERGWPPPLVGDSGNGGHLVYGIELSSDDGGLVKRVLAALAFIFDTDSVKVDLSVSNPARISKLYGTMARKGPNTPERPHRRSAIRRSPRFLRVVSKTQLEALAGAMPIASRATPPTTGATLEVETFLAEHQVAVRNVKDWQGGKRWLLERCVFNPEHTDRSAYVVQFPNGAVAAGCHHNSCQGQGWREFRSKLDPTWTPPASGGSVTTPGGSTENKWPDPQPVVCELPPVDPFTLDLLPGAFRAWIADIGERVQCPLDFLGIALLIAVATVVGRRIAIRPKRHDDWVVVANLWGAAIGRPGILKTPAIQEVLKPLRRLEIEAKKQFDAEMKEYLGKALIAKEQAKVTKKGIREAIEAGEDTAKLAHDAIAGEPDLPRRVRYLVNDATVEKLGELLNENPNGLLTFRDELIGFLRSLDKEGHESARAFYLEAWSGNGRFTYDRIQRGTVDIEATTVSILGCIQPGPLSHYLRGAIEGTQDDDGFVQRFQLAVWPDVSKEWFNVDRWPDTEAKNAAFRVFERLSKLTAESVGATPDTKDPEGLPFLRFDAEGQQLFDAWREIHEPRVRGGSEHPAIETHLAKFRSLVPSIALLLHLADGNTGPVEGRYVRTALAWAVYLESHARRIYSVAINAEAASAKALSKKIVKREIKDKFSLRDVYRHGWTGLSTHEDAQRAVNVLIDLDWIVEVVEKTAGAPKKYFVINPKVFELPTDTDRTDKSADDDWGTT